MDGFWTKAGRGAPGTASMGAHGVVGFISATSLEFDPGSLTGQKAGIDAAASAAGVVIDAYLVELSPRREGDPWTPAVKDLLLLARVGRLRRVVLDRIDRFAADRDDAMLVAVTLLGSNVEILEASSEASVAAPCTAVRSLRWHRTHRNLARIAS